MRGHYDTFGYCRFRNGAAYGRSLSIERGPDWIGDAAVGEDDAADTTFNGAERSFDFDHHAACRRRQGGFRRRGVDFGDQ